MSISITPHVGIFHSGFSLNNLQALLCAYLQNATGFTYKITECLFYGVSAWCSCRGYVPKDAGFLAMPGEMTKRKVCEISSASLYDQRLAVETK